MNRNHQGRNDQNRTKQGRHRIAYRQMGKSNQSPSYQSFSQRFGTSRFREASQDVNDNEMAGEWVSHFNGPDTQQNKAHHFSREDHWSEYENDETKSYDYDRFHSGAEPISINAREKYRHQEVQNRRMDYHGRDLSYRARMERHPERFVGENEAVLEQQFNVQPDFSGIGPKGYKRTDERLQDEVCDLLAKDRNIDASNLFVAVENGIVKLAGTVPKREDRYLVERAVDGIWGIVDIENGIKVGRKDNQSSLQ